MDGTRFADLAGRYERKHTYICADIVEDVPGRQVVLDRAQDVLFINNLAVSRHMAVQ